MISKVALKSHFSNRFFRPLLFFLLVVIFLTNSHLRDYSITNIWSLRFLWSSFSSEIGSVEKLVLPQQHKRAYIWQIQHLIRLGDIETSKEILNQGQLEGSPEEIRLKGYAHLTLGEYALAVESWKKIGDSQSIKRIGDEFVKRQQYDEAVLAYEAFLELKPEEGSWLLANLLFLQMFDYKYAEKVLRGATENYPNSIYYQGWVHRLGEVLRSGENWDEAENIYKQLILENASDGRAYIGLGWTYYESGKSIDVSMNEFQKAFEIDPENGEIAYSIANFLSQANLIIDADKWYATATELEPENVTWQLSRANLARDNGRLQFSIDRYNEILNYHPDNAQTYYELAWAYRLDGNKAQAINTIGTALLLEKSNDWYYVRAGAIYKWCEKDKIAIKAYLDAVEINPCNEHALKNLSSFGTNFENRCQE